MDIFIFSQSVYSQVCTERKAFLLQSARLHILWPIREKFLSLNNIAILLCQAFKTAFLWESLFFIEQYLGFKFNPNFLKKDSRQDSYLKRVLVLLITVAEAGGTAELPLNKVYGNLNVHEEIKESASKEDFCHY